MTVTYGHSGERTLNISRTAAIASLLFLFALAVRLLVPYAEWNLDGNHILQTVIYYTLQGAQAGGVKLRYWYQDNLYQWWLEAIYPVREFANPLTIVSFEQALLIASLLPKILGALNIALLFCLSILMGADRKTSLLISLAYAVTAQHVVLSSIVERQIISQTLLLISFLLVAAAPRTLYRRYATYGLALVVNVFGIVCYSPPIIFLPFLLAFMVSYEVQKYADARRRLNCCLAILGLFLLADLLVFIATGASVLSVLKQAIENFVLYADPGSQDEFSKIDKSLIVANVFWLFGHLFQWLPYYRSERFPEISFWAVALSAIVVAYCLYRATASLLVFRRYLNSGFGDFFGTASARLGILSAAFLTGVAFTLVVRHGNQTEFYIMPYTFILPVVAERLSHRRTNGGKTTVALSICVAFVFLTLLNHPYIGKSLQERNVYLETNADTILPWLLLKPE
ncbi:hypothetical protein [Agrobacterium tumefaciens]|uniref:hypothetical protein n=1 Tax=Agrobacterium tumefaciens TaxID=358 RepID=UPI0015736A68|nr:hypothetical protein [Agrobacterium tumefaciens]NTB04251.1 hypothetical protein [Agrobacterium tumefaciens]